MDQLCYLKVRHRFIEEEGFGAADHGLSDSNALVLPAICSILLLCSSTEDPDAYLQLVVACGLAEAAKPVLNHYFVGMTKVVVGRLMAKGHRAQRISHESRGKRREIDISMSLTQHFAFGVQFGR